MVTSADRKMLVAVNKAIPNFWMLIYVTEFASRSYENWRYEGLNMPEGRGTYSNKQVCHWATRHGIKWVPYNEGHLGNVIKLVSTALDNKG